jgi:D-alanyl-D-alanine carboxypeptidase (penicillin-binding protein 5/6)
MIFVFPMIITYAADNMDIKVYVSNTKDNQEIAVGDTPSDDWIEIGNADVTETAAGVGPAISSPSAILMEATTGQVIYEQNADEALHPASITKIMTLILIFEAIDNGQIALTDNVSVSEHAASMGGSQVFLEPGETQTVETMIKCISIASANDACVAMAELISGSEEGFVQAMNEKAAELGMKNTKFVNCCGLDIDGHMSTARDVALMSRELITKHPQIHNYTTIWMDTITHITKKGESEFGLTNTNKLVRQYQYATGLKTGSTGLAKFCLSATAQKNGIDLIGVIMAAPDSKTRFADAISLLNYGFSVCDIYTDENMPELAPVVIRGGNKESIDCQYAKQFSYLFMDRVNHDEISSNLNMYTDVKAPIKAGDVVGQLTYTYKNQTLGSVDVIATEDVRKATFGDSFARMLGRMLFKKAA